jgi:hypothetical protein
MTSQPNVSPLRQRMIDDMRMRQLSPKTQANYLRIVREFSRYLGRSPDTATVEDLRSYQLHLVDHGTSPVSLNAAITGLDNVKQVGRSCCLTGRCYSSLHRIGVAEYPGHQFSCTVRSPCFHAALQGA